MFAMTDKEKWKDFSGACMNSKPMWDGRIVMCSRWNIRGFCFDNCKNMSSHVEDEEKPQVKQQKKAWMAKVRASC